MSDGNKWSNKLKETSCFQLAAGLSVYNVLLIPGIKRLKKNAKNLKYEFKETKKLSAFIANYLKQMPGPLIDIAPSTVQLPQKI